jgi:signal transduction histidine kinase
MRDLPDNCHDALTRAQTDVRHHQSRQRAAEQSVADARAKLEQAGTRQGLRRDRAAITSARAALHAAEDTLTVVRRAVTLSEQHVVDERHCVTASETTFDATAAERTRLTDAVSAIYDARATAPDRNIEPRVDGDTTVVGDAHQLRQVLANLLRNALVHTPAGTPIEVSVERENGAVKLEVRDHGPGLPTDDADALFERFWRAEGGRERGKGGAVLGLTIVAGIVDAHGGSVSATNAPGGGAAFSVLLPAR